MPIINCGVGCRWCEGPLSIVVWGIGGVSYHYQLWCGVEVVWVTIINCDVGCRWCELPLSIVVWGGGGVGYHYQLWCGVEVVWVTIINCGVGCRWCVAIINCGVGCQWCEWPLPIVVWGVGGAKGHYQLWCGV